MNTLAILAGYFRQLSATIIDYFGLVNLHLNLNAPYFERLNAFVSRRSFSPPRAKEAEEQKKK